MSQNETTKSEWWSQDYRFVYSFTLMIAGLLIYIITKNGDLAILNLLGAIWMKLP